MRFHTLYAPLAAAAMLAGCADVPDPAAPSFAQGGVTASATGDGHFDAGVDVVFSLGVVQTDAGSEAANGTFAFSTVLGGEVIAFEGRATCLAVDPEHGRAWIAGVVTANGSTHSAFTGAINQVGRDIWFRVVDYGEGGNAPQADRTTFVGFEGSAGIITSAEYCATRPWPGPPADAPDARTGPVTEGNIQVRTR